MNRNSVLKIFLIACCILFSFASRSSRGEILWTSNAIQPYVPEGFENLEPTYLKTRSFGGIFRDTRILWGGEGILLYLPFAVLTEERFIYIEKNSGRVFWKKKLQCPPEYPRFIGIQDLMFSHDVGYFQMLCEDASRNALSEVYRLQSKEGKFIFQKQSPGVATFELWTGEIPGSGKILFLRTKRIDSAQSEIIAFESGQALWNSSLPLSRASLHSCLKAPFFLHLLRKELYQFQRTQKGLQTLRVPGFAEYANAQPCSEPRHWTNGNLIFTSGKKCYAWGSLKEGWKGNEYTTEPLENMYPYPSLAPAVMVVNFGRRLSGISIDQGRELWRAPLTPLLNESFFFPEEESLWQVEISSKKSVLKEWNPANGSVRQSIIFPSELVDFRLPIISLHLPYILSLHLSDRKIFFARLKEK